MSIEENIKDKVIAITGASSGIGRATAERLALGGARLVIGARQEGALQEVADGIRSKGGEVVYLATDVKNRGDVQKLVDLACEKYGHLDVLFSNAGIMPIGPLDDLKVEDWDEMVDVNLKGVLYGIAAALPLFRKQGFGHFVHTASTAGHKTVVNQSVYSATKFAVRALSEGLRQEAGDKIRVTIISPGFVNTNFTASVTDSAMKEQLAASRDKFAMPPDAVARAVAYAIGQPADIDVSEIIIRPTAQG